MPAALRADRKYRSGALGCSTSVRVGSIASQRKDEDASSPLRHSEEASVENPVRHAIPEVDHFTEETPKVSASIAGQESRDVFEEEGWGSVLFDEVEEDEGEDGSVAGETLSLACDGEVLAGEPAGPEVSVKTSWLDPALARSASATGASFHHPAPVVE